MVFPAIWDGEGGGGGVIKGHIISPLFAFRSLDNLATWELMSRTCEKQDNYTGCPNKSDRVLN